MYFYKFTVFHDGDHSYFGFLDFNSAQVSRLTLNDYSEDQLDVHFDTIRSSEDGNSTFHRNPRSAYVSVSQPPGRGPLLGPGINYTGPREVLLEFVILVF